MALNVKKPSEALNKKKLKLSKKGKIIITVFFLLLLALVIIVGRLIQNARESHARDLIILETIEHALTTVENVTDIEKVTEMLTAIQEERNIENKATKSLEMLKFILLNENLNQAAIDELNGAYNRINIALKNYIREDN